MTLTITLAIVIVTVLVSIRGFSQQQVIDDLIFYPPAVDKRNQYYRFISHGFIHADFLHLALNMFVFYSFGSAVEYYFNGVFGSSGWYYFIILYLGGMLISSAPTYKKHKENYARRVNLLNKQP